MARALGHSLVRLLNDIEEKNGGSATRKTGTKESSKERELEALVVDLKNKLAEKDRLLLESEEKLNTLKSILG